MVLTKKLFKKIKRFNLEPKTAFYESSIPYKKIPIIPKTKGIQKGIVNITRETKDVISGSYAQAALTKYPRRFQDIDILSENVKRTIRKIKEKFGDKVIFKKKFRAITVINKKTGKELADIVPFEKGETIKGINYVNRYGIVEVNGLRFVSPKTRLASKIAQLRSSGTKEKVLKDIKILTREKGFALKPKKQSLFNTKKGGIIKWM
jgi:hypothetical protein